MGVDQFLREYVRWVVGGGGGSSGRRQGFSLLPMHAHDMLGRRGNCGSRGGAEPSAFRRPRQHRALDDRRRVPHQPLGGGSLCRTASPGRTCSPTGTNTDIDICRDCACLRNRSRTCTTATASSFTSSTWPTLTIVSFAPSYTAITHGPSLTAIRPRRVHLVVLVPAWQRCIGHLAVGVVIVIGEGRQVRLSIPRTVPTPR
mmetsp:Transcript_21494/g.53168  ORF Transcript_21494/g.53168 Transcript_21494/m.53168 type:complete len:201 (-) Transcript_21494:410-1012(-)